MKHGLVCNLTGNQAAFEHECPDFVRDETVADIPENNESIETSEIKEKLSPEVIEKLKLEQKLMPGILAASVAGVLGAVVWAAITLTTGYQIGYMAIAIGALVGFTMRKVGNGIDPIFAYWGAGISLVSVLLGNIFSIIGYVANAFHLKYFDALLSFDYSFLPEMFAQTFSIIDLLFYGLAVFEGYKFSFRQVTDQQVLELRGVQQ